MSEKKGLFKSSNLDYSVDRLKVNRLRSRRENPTDLEYKKMYLKHHKKALTLRAKEVWEKSDEEIYEILMCGAYALKKDMPRYLGLETEELNTKDLEDFLNIDVASIYKKSTKTFSKKTQGLKFLDGFTRRYYTNVLKQDSGGALEDDLKSVLDVCNISLHLAPAHTRMTTRRYFSTYTHASTKNRLQFASNFNPLITAYLFNTYGKKVAKANKRQEINLHSSSEGWLSRLLASYYVACKNPNYNVNYISIDPNIKVVKAFNELVAYLKNNRSVNNWNPKIINDGSEVKGAYLKDYRIDVSFTSPPYLDLEEYPDTLILKTKKGEYKVSALDEVFVKRDSIKMLVCGDKIRVGDKYRNGKMWELVYTISKTPQCATLYKTARKWDTFFCEPTFKHISTHISKGGYLIWNVVNFKKHPNIENSSTTIAKGLRYRLESTLKYPLIRKPGSSGVLDAKGGNVRLADIKKPYEPIFIFCR